MAEELITVYDKNGNELLAPKSALREKKLPNEIQEAIDFAEEMFDAMLTVSAPCTEQMVKNQKMLADYMKPFGAACSLMAYYY